MKMPVRAGDLRVWKDVVIERSTASRRLNLRAIDATLDADPAPSRTCRSAATRARRASASRLGIGAAWQKQFWDFFFLLICT